MFKNLIAYRIPATALPDVDTLNQALQEHPFTPCGSTELSRRGFVVALSDDSGLFAQPTSGGAILVRLRTQHRVLTAKSVNQALQRQISAKQEQEGRKVGKKEAARLKDELIFSLLPNALTEDSDMLALLYPAHGLILIGASSASNADSMLNSMRLALGSLPVRRPAFKAPLSSFMTAWLHGMRDLPDDFVLGERVELVGEDGAVKAVGLDLCSQEVKEHLEAGREVRKLELCFQNAVYFEVGHDFRLGRLVLAEKSLESLNTAQGEDRMANLEAELFLWQRTALDLVSALSVAFDEEAQF